MQYFCSILFGCLTVATMYCTIRYVLPRIQTRLQNAACKPAGEAGGDTGKTPVEGNLPVWLVQPGRQRILLAAGAFYGLFFGYVMCDALASVVSWLEVAVVFFVLAAAFVTDIAYHIIPNCMTGVILVVRTGILLGQLVLRTEHAGRDIRNSILVMVVVTLMLLMVNWLTHGGIGLGDVKLISAIGFMSGLRDSIYTLFFSFLVCMVVSTILLMMKKKTMKDTVPLGPFIWVGYGMALFVNR